MISDTLPVRPSPVRWTPARWTPGARRWAGWLASRGLTLLLLVPEHKVLGDVRYYFGALDAVFRGGPVGPALPEYPAPVLAFLGLPHLVSGPAVPAYLAAFVLLILAVDAALTRALFRVAGPRAPGVTLWVCLPPLLGPMFLCRFDLLPAALAAGALLAVTTRPARAGVLAGFGAVLGVAVGLVAALAGGSRLTSPLSWQGARGLQLEAYAALPLLVAGAFRPGIWHVEYTRFYAFQLVGPGTGAALTAATAASGLAVLLLAVLWLRAARRREALPPAAPGLLAVLTVCLMATTDKTLSPQYLIWVAALVAVVGVTHPDALPRGTVPLLLATCALTQLIFPLNYDPLVAVEPYAVLLLAVRDAGLLAVTWLVGRQLWLLTRRPAQRSDGDGDGDGNGEIAARNEQGAERAPSQAVGAMRRQANEHRREEPNAVRAVRQPGPAR